ncbi:MAG: sigma-54-dependent transcriptional regulator [Planctomycetota bacterium]
MTDSREVLLIDDDPDLIRLVELELGAEGFSTLCATSAAEGLALHKEHQPSAAVLDLGLPDQSGQNLLPRLLEASPHTPVVILSAQDEIDTVVECMRLGATDYVTKPFARPRLATAVRAALVRGSLRQRVDGLTRKLRSGEGLASLRGSSKAIAAAKELLRRAAASDVGVLLTGESGTGKEVAARAIHAESPRRSGPFVAVNCGAIPEKLIESELFGHSKGAFTGATESRRGQFELASGGTIFLDEIGELRIDLQVRLLRVLQEHMIEPLGAERARAINVRVIAATNRDLKQGVQHGTFREDLYYRLAVFPVTMPPLRERGEDVFELADLFLARFAKRHQRSQRPLSDEARRAIGLYRWPGNVRELENVIERATIIEDGEIVNLGSLTESVVCALDDEAPTGPTAASSGSGSDSAPDPSGKPTSLPQTIIPFAEAERRLILRALRITEWNVQEAATRLGIGRATIYRKIERYGLR